MVKVKKNEKKIYIESVNALHTKNAPPHGGATMTCYERVPFAKCKLYDSIANIKYLSEIHKKNSPSQLEGAVPLKGVSW